MKICLHGYAGAMGQMVTRVTSGPLDQISVGIDKGLQLMPSNFPVHQNFKMVNQEFDVIIDFSHHSLVKDLLGFAVSQKKPLVLCTTGLDQELQSLVLEASKQIPIFQSGNMSYGIQVLERILARFAPLLQDQFDIEIVEKHHRRKVDAPSGTALMLANTIKSAIKDTFLTMGRHGTNAQRQPKEIGLHAVRGGTIVGEHQVIFAGNQEVITLTHQAESREVFAHGALRAARYLLKQPAGLYDMHTMIAEEELDAQI